MCAANPSLFERMTAREAQLKTCMTHQLVALMNVSKIELPNAKSKGAHITKIMEAEFGVERVNDWILKEFHSA